MNHYLGGACDMHNTCHILQVMLHVMVHVMATHVTCQGGSCCMSTWRSTHVTYHGGSCCICHWLLAVKFHWTLSMNSCWSCFL